MNEFTCKEINKVLTETVNAFYQETAKLHDSEEAEKQIATSLAWFFEHIGEYGQK